jgi:putative DNA primase/helicase
LLLFNELPEFEDDSGTLLSRLVVFHFKNSFWGKEDPDLLAKLIAELPGIFNLIVKALQRLLADGKLITPPSGMAKFEEFAEKPQNIRAFVADECELNSARREAAWRILDCWRCGPYVRTGMRR